MTLNLVQGQDTVAWLSCSSFCANRATIVGDRREVFWTGVTSEVVTDPDAPPIATLAPREVSMGPTCDLHNLIASITSFS